MTIKQIEEIQNPNAKKMNPIKEKQDILITYCLLNYPGSFLHLVYFSENKAQNCLLNK